MKVLCRKYYSQLFNQKQTMNCSQNPVMPKIKLQTGTRTTLIIVTALAISGGGFVAPSFAADEPARITEHALVAFEGDKTAWHGFDRYDFLMDENTLAITPIKA